MHKVFKLYICTTLQGLIKRFTKNVLQSLKFLASCGHKVDKILFL